MRLGFESSRKVLVSCINLSSIGFINLFFPQTFNAGELTQWCLQFIALNYTLYHNKAAYKNTIKGEDRTFVEKHRWPTQDDIEALRQYKRMTKANKEHVKFCTIS